ILQAEDSIRDRNVTGVQTCALPISETMAIIHAVLAVLRNATKRSDSHVIADKSSALSFFLFVIARMLRIFFTENIYFLMRWNFNLMPLVRLIIVIWLRIDMCNRPPRLWQR